CVEVAVFAGELDATAGAIDLAMFDDRVAEDRLGRAPGAQVDAGAAGVVDQAVFDAQALAGLALAEVNAAGAAFNVALQVLLVRAGQLQAADLPAADGTRRADGVV